MADSATRLTDTFSVPETSVFGGFIYASVILFRQELGLTSVFAEVVENLTRCVSPILGIKTDGQDPPTVTDCQSVGTGFFISDFGTLVTAAHVLDSAVESGLVHSFDGKKWLGLMPTEGQDEEGILLNPEFKWALPVCVDREIDTCVLQIWDKFTTHPIPFCERRVRPGEPVGTLGFPMADYQPGNLRTHLRFFGGFVCSWTDRQLQPGGKECFAYETDIMFLPGLSGGPVVTTAGELIGFVHGTVALEKALVTLSLVVSVNELGKLIVEALGKKPEKLLAGTVPPSHPKGPRGGRVRGSGLGKA